jgi:hypothetical protein
MYMVHYNVPAVRPWPGELTATLAEGVARLGTKMPFELALAEVAFFLGVELEETTVRDTPRRPAPRMWSSKWPSWGGWSASYRLRETAQPCST